MEVLARPLLGQIPDFPKRGLRQIVDMNAFTSHLSVRSVRKRLLSSKHLRRGIKVDTLWYQMCALPFFSSEYFSIDVQSNLWSFKLNFVHSMGDDCFNSTHSGSSSVIFLVKQFFFSYVPYAINVQHFEIKFDLSVNEKIDSMICLRNYLVVLVKEENNWIYYHVALEPNAQWKDGNIFPLFGKPVIGMHSGNSIFSDDLDWSLTFTNSSVEMKRRVKLEGNFQIYAFNELGRIGGITFANRFSEDIPSLRVCLFDKYLDTVLNDYTFPINFSHPLGQKFGEAAKRTPLNSRKYTEPDCSFRVFLLSSYTPTILLVVHEFKIYTVMAEGTLRLVSEPLSIPDGSDIRVVSGMVFLIDPTRTSVSILASVSLLSRDFTFRYDYLKHSIFMLSRPVFHTENRTISACFESHRCFMHVSPRHMCSYFSYPSFRVTSSFSDGIIASTDSFGQARCSDLSSSEERTAIYNSFTVIDDYTGTLLFFPRECVSDGILSFKTTQHGSFILYKTSIGFGVQFFVLQASEDDSHEYLIISTELKAKKYTGTVRLLSSTFDGGLCIIADCNYISIISVDGEDLKEAGVFCSEFVLYAFAFVVRDVYFIMVFTATEIFYLDAGLNKIDVLVNGFLILDVFPVYPIQRDDLKHVFIIRSGRELFLLTFTRNSINTFDWSFETKPFSLQGYIDSNIRNSSCYEV
ncbi:hypothetical protein PCE1_000327 [Barthelona sp. PCE]